MAHLYCRISEQAIIVNNEGKILILQDMLHDEPNGMRIPSDKWLFPGGRVEETDNPAEALLREIKEETGLTNIRILLPVHTSRWGHGSHHRYSVIYLAMALGPCEVRIQQEEAHNFRWVSWEEAQKINFIYPTFVSALRKARAIYSLQGIQDFDFLAYNHPYSIN